MRHTLLQTALYGSLSLLILTALTACINDKTEILPMPGADEPLVPIRLTAGMAMTRATDGLNNSHFDDAVNINVYTTGAEYTFRTVGTDGTMNCTSVLPPYFPSGDGATATIQAYYPSTVHYGTEPLTFTVAANQDQTSSGEAGYKASDLMYGTPASNPVAKTEDPIPVSFTHRMAKIKVVATTNGATIKKIVMTNVKRKIAYTPATNTLGTAEDVMDEDEVTPLNTIVMYEDATGTSAATYTATAIIPKQRLADDTPFITVTTTKDLIYKLPVTTETYIDFDPGKQYTYNLSITDFAITGHVSVTDWDDTPEEVADYANLHYTLENVTTDQIGWAVCSDGSVYEKVAHAVASGKTPVAMVAYISSPGNGLAYALEDESEAKYLESAIVLAGDTKNSTMPVVGGIWRLPSVDDYKWMFYGAGDTANGDIAYNSTTDSYTEYKCGRLRTRLAALGASYDLLEEKYYLTSSTRDVSLVWTYAVNSPLNSLYRFSGGTIGANYWIRAVLAF